MYFIILHYNNSVILNPSKINTKSVNIYHSMKPAYTSVLKRNTAVIRLQAQKHFCMTAVSSFFILPHDN